MSDRQGGCTPILPPELERDIFERAAWSCRGTAVVFALVARRVQQWMESYLYDTVTLASRTVCDRFLYVVGVRPPAFFVATVKSLCIPGDIAPEDALRVLEVCKGVVNLAYWITVCIRPSRYFAAISSLRPERLSINAGGLFGREVPPDFTHPFFEQVTHLEVVDWPFVALSSVPSRFELLPSLTHLAVDVDRYDESIINQLRSVLKACPRLRVLLCLVPNERAMIDASHAFRELDKDDGRIVILSDSDPLENWEGSLIGSYDTCPWTYAEAMIVEKRNSKT
ncbi:hypothetical protein LshimejAT787_1301190 [Lyophyllum shimeji]|uniref:Uncharacterized protein n=1 Tax=Lyophyllum shimeji TaxID=47721 RepID=A0A9P3PX55_LYOSH|nr:hypothetical protein LshimejAT787_1301190 [Lyophyllum shimeji]